MTIPAWLGPAIRDRYTSCCSSNDYGGFVDWIHELERGGQIDSADLDYVLSSFEDPAPVPEAEPNDEEGVYSYLTDPPDPGSLSELPLRGWVRECEDSLRSTDEDLRRMLGIDDKEALMDIQENATITQETFPGHREHRSACAAQQSRTLSQSFAHPQSSAHDSH